MKLLNEIFEDVEFLDKLKKLASLTELPSEKFFEVTTLAYLLKLEQEKFTETNQAIFSAYGEKTPVGIQLKKDLTKTERTRFMEKREKHLKTEFEIPGEPLKLEKEFFEQQKDVVPQDLVDLRKVIDMEHLLGLKKEKKQKK